MTVRGVVLESPVADVAQLAERVLGKDEVTSSILVIGSNVRSLDPDTSVGGPSRD